MNTTTQILHYSWYDHAVWQFSLEKVIIEHVKIN